MFDDFDERYTPKELDDIVFHTEEARELIEDCVSGVIGFPSSGKNGILLYGVNGTGKSALARLIPNLIEKANGYEGANYPKFVNISQGGDNGSKVIDDIKSQAFLIPFQNRFNHCVLDEVDNLRKETMDSLKVAMNIASNLNVYVLTTNKISEIERGVQDRCIRVEFNAAPSIAWLPRFRRILDDYKVSGVTDADALRIIDLCEGSARAILLAARQLIIKHYRKNKMQLQLAA